MHQFTLCTRPTLTERLRDARRTSHPAGLPGLALHFRLSPALVPRLPQRALRPALEGFRP